MKRNQELAAEPQGRFGGDFANEAYSLIASQSKVSSKIGSLSCSSNIGYGFDFDSEAHCGAFSQQHDGAMPSVSITEECHVLGLLLILAIHI